MNMQHASYSANTRNAASSTSMNNLQTGIGPFQQGNVLQVASTQIVIDRFLAEGAIFFFLLC